MRSIPALASSLAWLGSGIGGIVMGRVADKIGTRWTVIFGALMVALGLAISTLGPHWALWIGHGLFIGLIGLSGITQWHFWSGLILLGLGWNFGFVGASTMVVETHRPEERNRVQSFNDFLVFGSMAITSFSSGQILASHGWEAVNWVAFPPILFAVVALTLTGAYRSRQVVAA